MYVKLDDQEIAELLHWFAPEGKLPAESDYGQTLLGALEKLKLALTLAPVVGDSFVDPQSPAAQLLLASAGIRATVVARTPEALSVPLERHEEDEVDQPSQNWPNTRPSFLNTPFGWEQRGDKLVASKKEQEVIKCALKAKKREWTYQQIADDLNGRHHRTRRGSRWTAQTVRHLLTKSVEHKQNKELKKKYG